MAAVGVPRKDGGLRLDGQMGTSSDSGVLFGERHVRTDMSAAVRRMD